MIIYYYIIIIIIIIVYIYIYSTESKLKLNGDSMVNTMSRPFALCQEKTPNLVVEPKEIARPNTQTAFNERAKSKSGKQNTKTPIIENVIFCDIPRLYGGICEF